MSQLHASELINYNANSRGTDTGDCVCRAISLAYQKPYNDVKRDLNAMAKQLHSDSYKIKPVWGSVIAKYGYEEQGELYHRGETNPLPTVDEFADAHPDGIFILLVGKDTDYRTSHMVCVSEGRVFDSWNCKKWFVKSYYLVSGKLELTDIGDHIVQLESLADELIRENVQKQADKYKMTLTDLYVGHPLFRNKYAVDLDVGFKVEDFKVFTKSYNIKIVFTPTMSYEEAQAKVRNLVKVRIYDRMYELHKDIEAQREGWELLQQSQSADNDEPKRLYLTTQERRFYNSLPGWVKPFVTNIMIQYPGQYSDSYWLSFKPLPGDPNPEKVILRAYDSKEMKIRLEEYKKNFERHYPYFDYY